MCVYVCVWGRGVESHALVPYPKTHRKTDLYPASNQKQTREKAQEYRLLLLCQQKRAVESISMWEVSYHQLNNI